MSTSKEPHFRVLRNKSTSLHLKYGLVGKDNEKQEIVVCNTLVDLKPRAFFKDHLGVFETLQNRKGKFFLIEATKEQMDEMAIPAIAREGNGFRNPFFALEDVTRQYKEMQAEIVDPIGVFEFQRDVRAKAQKAETLEKENAALLSESQRLAMEKDAALKELAALKAEKAAERVGSGKR